MENLEKFWDSCDSNFAHISLSRHLPGYDKLTKTWENSFISKINFKGKSVIDYGIGGGFLGKYLFEKKEISKYIGIDISKRSLSHANNNLSQYSNKINLLHTDEFYSKFNENAQIFISQACIQHFPDELYLLSFLNKINLLSCDTLMLQIRKGDTTFFSNTKNKKLLEEDIVFACHTNSTFMSKYLTNYRQSYISNIDPTSKYQFIIYSKK
jgi:ubiquinone/menaquinone biosynthesis C-methylase UbiE